MSYDLYLLELGPDAGRAEIFARLEEEESSLPPPELRQLAARIAEERALDGYEYVEGERFVNIVNDVFGAVCDLRANGASINVAYWHKGERADDVMQSVIDLIGEIQQATGWILFDPQEGEVVTDLSALSSGSSREMDRVARWAEDNLSAPRDTGAPAKRPWWKFWS